MHQITVSDIPIDIVRKDIKNLHLSVHPPLGRVRIATPLRLDDEAVRLFAISKLAWIKKHRSNFETQARQSERQYVSGENHFVEGKRYLLNVLPSQSTAHVTIRNNTQLDLFIQDGSTHAQRERVMIKWYRQRLKDAIPPLIEKWEERMNVTVSAWGVKQMKTKWGSCNVGDKRIWLNLELAKKQRKCLEYILVHEMNHLVERKHNRRFVGLMDLYLPTWRISRDELNQAPLKSY